MSFATLKKTSGKFDKLQTELEKLSNPQQNSNYQDDRFWKPELDKSGNGYAVIRFLPQPDGEELPWVRMWNHAFNGPGGWYIENSLTTINKKDPVSEYNTELWNSGNDADKDTARKQKRVLKYYSNIYVVSDPKHPEREGKVFLFKYGKKIFDKLTEAMNPAFEDETPLNPFDLWKGADFKLKIRKVDGYWNYDKSEFAGQTALSDDDDELETIWKGEHSLQDFAAPDQFKSYDELKQKLHQVLSGTGVGSTTAEVMSKEDQIATADKKFGKPEATTKVEDKPSTGDDETLSYFAKLAEEG
jgi:hypothetical protein|tara:strand:+ start:791 stop:1693 length:903 start_codon:yes stop_codon:yes gene_type:complete